MIKLKYGEKWYGMVIDGATLLFEESSFISTL